MENGRIDYKVVLDTSAMQAEANQVTRSFQNMTAAARSEGAKIDDAFSSVAGNIGRAFAALGAAATFQQLSQKILQVRGQFQQLEVAFETMIGSAEEADKLMSQLVQTAATTPFGLQEVAGGAKQLLAYGIAADEVNDTLVRLGDIAAGLSIPLNDLVYLYGTTMTQGRLYTQDLRQFMGRGIPLVEELAKQFNVTKDRVSELVTEGKVGFPEVKKAIEDLTAEGSKFGGLMEKQSHTITGQISNIEDALDMMFNDLGKSSEGVINDILSGVSYVIEHYKTFGKILLELVATYGAYKAALIAIAAINQARAFAENVRLVMMMRKEIGLATAAQQAFNITAKANPYGLIAAAIAAVIGALILFVDHTDEATKAQERLNSIKTEAAGKAAEEREQIELLIKAAKNEKLAMEDRLTAVKKLNQIIPNYNAQLDATTGKYIENTNALNQYLQALARKYELEGAKDRLKEIGKNIATARIELRKATEEQKEASNARQSTYNGAGAFIPTPIVGAKEVDDATSKINKANQNLKEAYKERDLIYKEYGVDLQKDAVKEPTPSPTPTPSPKPKKTTTKSGTGSKTGSKADKPDLKQIQYNVDELMSEWDDALSKMKEKMALDIVDASIDALDEGTDKQVRRIKQSTKKQLDALDDEIKELQKKKLEEDKKIWLEQNPNKKEYDYKTPAEEGIEQFLEKYPELKTLYEARKQQIEEAGGKSTKKVRDDAAKAERNALEGYLMEYGSYTDKRLAITERYMQEIADATTIGEKLSLQRQLQDALQAIDFNALKEEINWEEVFNDLDKISIESLEKLKKQLKDALKAKDLTAEDAKTISEQIKAINDQLIIRQKAWRESFGLVIPELEEQRRLIQEAKEAQEQLNEAQEKHRKASDEVNRDQKAITDYIKAQGKEYSGDINTASADKIMSLFAGDKTAGKGMEDLLLNLSKSEGKLATTTTALGKAQEGASMAATKAGGNIASTVAIIDAIVNKVNDNVKSANDLVKQLGLGDTSFGKGFSSFAESSQYAVDAWNALKSGNIMGVANGVVGSLRTLGDALGEWGIGFFGSSDKTLVKDLERLTRSNESLEGAVSRLTKTMEQQAGSDLTKTYTEAVDDLEIAMANTQEMIARSAAAYSNGFFGIGGKGSTNKKIAKLLSTSDWERISQIMGRTITDVSQIWDMSSEEMGKLLEHAPDIWAKFKEGASDGYKDISDYLDSYVELYDKLIDLQQQYNESITQTSFDNIKSGLADLINDTETNAYDVIGNVTTMLQNSILNIVLTKSMKPKLDKWYEDFANSMADDTLTAMEHAALEEGYADIYKQAKEEVDRAYKLAGIDPNTGDVEDASTGAWSALGEETGRSLDGRMTAIHIQVTKIADMMLLDHEAIGRMDMRSMQDSTTLNEMHNLIFLSTEHLERVARNSDALPQINSKLEQIRQNTDRL